MRITALIMAMLAWLLGGCFQEASKVEVPRDTARQCATHCQGLGMRLSAVVIIMSSAGCVCEPRDRVGARSGGSSAAAGGAAIHAAAQAAQQSQQQQQQQH